VVDCDERITSVSPVFFVRQVNPIQFIFMSQR